MCEKLVINLKMPGSFPMHEAFVEKRQNMCLTLNAWDLVRRAQI